MSPTVHELRNEIRLAVGRYERVEQTGFTKESLAAIAEAVGYTPETVSRPPKGQVRAGIRWKVGLREDDDPDAGGGTFRKADLQAIAEFLREE
ncbi:hypothetical protein ACFPYI_18300 [Halomarina salina]|uniref:Uncharacterized protein n=1 Tax=Halomarina salina TaxID=1872699 RepID=A0ABD5RRQ3_9EURY|nr:hypothetical protein [Halomarina salina]